MAHWGHNRRLFRRNDAADFGRGLSLWGLAQMNTLVFIRHGETDMAGRFCGHSDPELNQSGETQIARAAEEVAPLGVQRIYSSDLVRAARTATVIGRRITIGVELQPGLREMNFGLWEGLSWQEIEERYPREAAEWLQEFRSRTAPAGETYADFTTRVDAAIEPLLGGTPASVTAVVSHRGVMNYALTKFFGFTEAEARTKTAPYGAVVVAAARRKRGEL
jgi:alpha-ribazole phosphatase/probable phosphoglycerate mutase